MEIIIWILFGALAGWAASKLMGAGGGLLWNILIGIVGAVLGGFIMSVISKVGIGSFNLYNFLVAVLGASLLIAIIRLVRRQLR